MLRIKVIRNKLLYYIIMGYKKAKKIKNDKQPNKEQQELKNGYMIRKVLMDLKKEMENLPPNTMIDLRGLVDKK
jgi:hypothetical protein